MRIETLCIYAYVRVCVYMYVYVCGHVLAHIFVYEQIDVYAGHMPCIYEKKYQCM